MKTLKDFTPEIQAKIPEYIKRYTDGVFDGKRYGNFKRENAEALIDWNYQQCGYDKPVVLVAENPYEAQIIFNYIVESKVFLPIIYAIYCLRNNKPIDKLRSELRSELYSKLRSKLDSELDSELDIKLDSELDIKLDSELDSELDSKLYIKLDSELYSKLRSKLDSKLDSELYIKLYSELDSELYSKLRSELDSELHGKLDSELRSELDIKLDSKLDSELYSEKIFKKNNDYLFTANVYSNVYAAWYKFIKDEFNIDSQIGVTLDSWNDLYLNSNIYSAIFSELICVVSKYPKMIHRNTENELHNPKGVSVEWGQSTSLTEFKCFHINGRLMPSWIFDENLTKEQFIEEQNEDIKAGIYEIIESNGEGTMLSFLGADEVDRQSFVHPNGEIEEMALYKTKEKFKEEVDLNGNSPSPLAWLKMTCPSTGTNYLIPSCGSFTNCIDAAKYHRPSEVPQDVDYFWNQRN